MKPKTLIGQQKEITKLSLLLDHGQHTAIVAPKRFGKTSLIRHLLNQSGNRFFIYTDIHKAISPEQLAYTILNKAFECAGIEAFTHRAQHESFEVFKAMQDAGIESLGETALSLINERLDSMELLLNILELVDQIAAHLKTRFILVMDEFQEIIDLGGKKTLDQLRSIAQHHQHITYVFLGSIKSKMNYIFQSKDSAFFHFVQTIELTGLEEEAVIEHCKQLFKLKTNESLNKDLIRLLRYLEFHPDYTHQVLEQIHYTLLISPERTIDRKLCLEAISTVFMNNKTYLEELISKAKLKKHHYAVLSATANEETIKLPSATLYQTRVSLENMGLLKKKSRDCYAITDALLRIFLCIPETSHQAVSWFIDRHLPKSSLT